MEKNKYQRASKNTKKEVQMAFFQTDFGVDLKKRLNRLIIYSILLIACAIYFTIDGIMDKYSISKIVVSVFFLIVEGLFIWGRHYVIVKSCNNYMINNPKRANDKK